MSVCLNVCVCTEWECMFMWYSSYNTGNLVITACSHLRCSLSSPCTRCVCVCPQHTHTTHCWTPSLTSVRLCVAGCTHLNESMIDREAEGANKIKQILTKSCGTASVIMDLTLMLAKFLDEKKKKINESKVTTLVAITLLVIFHLLALWFSHINTDLPLPTPLFLYLKSIT